MIPIDYRSTPLIDIARAEIAGKVAEYLAAGGQIHQVDGFEYKPLPPAKHPEPKEEPKRHGRPRMKPERQAELVRDIKRMATDGFSKTAILRQLRISWDVMRRLTDEFCIEFIDAKELSQRGNKGRAEASAETRARLAPRIIGLHKSGVSLTEIARRTGINRKAVTRTLEENGAL
ncbi:hypothetical protein [Pseudomonas knackmussii]|uniref:hypothetical protein n=1 Tax=Pseudomonas knackmussii TaxID=65741 RepID=UPI0013635640|nr:hypothetical protein [Pseudomonas knackmussii]